MKLSRLSSIPFILSAQAREESGTVAGATEGLISQISDNWLKSCLCCLIFLSVLLALLILILILSRRREEEEERSGVSYTRTPPTPRTY